MPTVVGAKGSVLDRVLDARSSAATVRLDRRAFGLFQAARLNSSWGERHQRTFALVEGQEILASAERYDLPAVLDGRPLRVCGIGSLQAHLPPSGHGHLREFVDTLLADAAREGAEMALLFSSPSDDSLAGAFHPMPLKDVTLGVAPLSRPGAPMTMVRGGEWRDLGAIATMGRTRNNQVRFHLDRDVDLIQYSITTNRLLAGLATAHARELHFFIAEEGITAAAYVVISELAGVWTIEECGDRDPSGARVGALLQALIARAPAERRPVIRGWLPPDFLPPQISIVDEVPATETIGVRMLDSRAIEPALSAHDVLFWHNDCW